MKISSAGFKAPAPIDGISVNFCKNPKCANFGVAETPNRGKRRAGALPQPGDYNLVASGKGKPTVHEGRWHEPAYTVAGLSNLIEATHKVVSNEELAAQGLNLIGRQDVIKGKTTRFPYCNLCIHCHAPQNNFYLSKKIYASKEMQSQGEGARYLEGAFADEAPAAPEHQVFGLAVIPREIEGAGLWVLQAQPIP